MMHKIRIVWSEIVEWLTAASVSIIVIVLYAGVVSIALEIVYYTSISPLEILAMILLLITCRFVIYTFNSHK